MMQSELILDAKATLGESRARDLKTQSLYGMDILEKEFMRAMEILQDWMI